MLTDAHCHPYDLSRLLSGVEAERRRLGVACAASATSREEFAHNEGIARKAEVEGAAPVLPCFAVHPQLPAANGGRLGAAADIQDGLEALENFAGQGRLAAVGETGFDLFNAAYRATEKIQDELFAAHLETALRYDLPLVLHIRRAMHKIFSHINALKKCRSVIFHSWPGTAGEGDALLKRGVNVFFSFGTPILLNHKEAMRCCALFPADRILTETDAPYQPLRGAAYSRWEDLPRILEAAAALRQAAGTGGSEAGELGKIVERNFRCAFASLKG